MLFLQEHRRIYNFENSTLEFWEAFRKGFKIVDWIIKNEKDKTK